jgi:hypothetical protein
MKHSFWNMILKKLGGGPTNAGRYINWIEYDVFRTQQW